MATTVVRSMLYFVKFEKDTFRNNKNFITKTCTELTRFVIDIIKSRLLTIFLIAVDFYCSFYTWPGIQRKSLNDFYYDCYVLPLTRDNGFINNKKVFQYWKSCSVEIIWCNELLSVKFYYINLSRIILLCG